MSIIKSLYEHNELSSTSCPSGRDPWATLVPALKAQLENDMPLNEADKQWIWDAFVAILRAPEFSVPAIRENVAQIRPKVDQNNSILFDHQVNDSPTDDRRLIKIGTNVKALSAAGPLTPANLALIAKAVNDDAAKRGVA